MRFIPSAVYIALTQPFLLAPAAIAAVPDVPTRDSPALISHEFFARQAYENGFAQMAVAADLLSASKAFAATQEPNATLTVKRQALTDPMVAQARQLVRLAMALPLVPLPPEPGLPPGSPNVAQFAKARQIARLLAVEQYVLMADGRTDAAVDSLRDGLHLSYFVKTQALIGGMVGNALESIWLRPMAERVDQLSARDCERLVAIIDSYLKAPDPVIAALEAERRSSVLMMSYYIQNTIEAVATDAGRIPQEDGDVPPAVMAALARLKNDPAARAVLRSRAAQRVNQYIDALIEQVRNPAKLGAPLPKSKGSATAAQDLFIDHLVELAQPTGARMVGQLVRSQTHLRLMGVHAAIRRYRWEHNRLPAALSELKLRSLAIDPFSGRELAYAITGEATYSLSSVGPRRLDETGNPIGEKREPVSLPTPRRTTPAPPLPSP